MTRWTKVALDYAGLGWRVVPCHHPVQWNGALVCSCCHKPSKKDPSVCGCGHRRPAYNLPCSCGRTDCMVRCSGSPCINVGKHPRTPHGLKDATTDRDQIEYWGQRWPDANIAVVMGHESGVFALDLDRHNPAEDGVENFLYLCKELRIGIPDTPLQITGGGGQHLVFRHPGSQVSIKNLTKKEAIRPGVEVKGDEGYIMVAPSQHKSGREWIWEASSHPQDVPAAECPGPLLDLIVGRASKPRPEASGDTLKSFLARLFKRLGWLGFDLPNGTVTARCPWDHEHTDGRGGGGDSSAVLLPPTNNRPLGGFKCSHGHCTHRGTVAVLKKIPEDALAKELTDSPEFFDLVVELLKKDL